MQKKIQEINIAISTIRTYISTAKPISGQDAIDANNALILLREELSEKYNENYKATMSTASSIVNQDKDQFPTDKG